MTAQQPEIRHRREQLGAKQIRVAWAVASGDDSDLDIANLYGITRGQIKRWRKLVRFRSEVERHRGYLEERAGDEWLAREQRISARLEEAEEKAVYVLERLLRATKPAPRAPGSKSKRIRYIPDNQVQLGAAVSLLDRGGMRGKPVERVQQANFNMQASDAGTALVSALADPGVRAFLMQDPTLADRARKELVQLALPEAPCDTSEASSLPSSEPPATPPS